MIEVKQVTKCDPHSQRSILNGVDFKVRNRRVYGLLGPVGAGKSTLMGMMAGVWAPTEGGVLINGYDINRQPKEAKAQLGFLPEKLPLFPDMTPYEYLSFVAAAKGVKGEMLSAQVKEALAVTGLVTRQDQLICRLSASGKKCLGIAQTLLGNPDTLLWDEPFEGLDSHSRNEIRELIRRLGQTRTVVISGHRLYDMEEICEQIILLHEGRVVADDTPEALAQRQPTLEDMYGIIMRQATEVPTADFEDESYEDAAFDTSEPTESEDA